MTGPPPATLVGLEDGGPAGLWAVAHEARSRDVGETVDTEVLSALDLTHLGGVSAEVRGVTTRGRIPTH